MRCPEIGPAVVSFGTFGADVAPLSESRMFHLLFKASGNPHIPLLWQGLRVDGLIGLAAVRNTGTSIMLYRSAEALRAPASRPWCRYSARWIWMTCLEGHLDCAIQVLHLFAEGAQW